MLAMLRRTPASSVPGNTWRRAVSAKFIADSAWVVPHLGGRSHFPEQHITSQAQARHLLSKGAIASKPSIVFSHGLWADGSGFSQVMAPLQAGGYEVIASEPGLNGLDGDVESVIRCIGRVSSPVILIGHSYGGTLITRAGLDNRVAGLVYRLFGNERGRAIAIVSIRHNLAVMGYRTGIQSRYLSWRSVMDSPAQRDQLPSTCNAHFDT
jgi:pimeloyl-ACP methyl ester carboxylesterase